MEKGSEEKEISVATKAATNSVAFLGSCDELSAVPKGGRKSLQCCEQKGRTLSRARSATPIFLRPSGLRKTRRSYPEHSASCNIIHRRLSSDPAMNSVAFLEGRPEWS